MNRDNKKMKFVGASGIIFRATAIASIPIIIVNYCWPTFFGIQLISNRIIIILAIILLGIGIPLYIYTLNTIKKVYLEETIVTKGVYSICRNPLFAIVIFLILPGVLLFFTSWLLLTIPLLLYMCFDKFIIQEELLLENTFGKEYVDYKKHTPRIIPKLWKYKK